MSVLNPYQLSIIIISFIPGINYFDNTRIRIKFDRHWWKIWWKQEKLAFTHNKVVNIYIVYEINLTVTHQEIVDIYIVYEINLRAYTVG